MSTNNACTPGTAATRWVSSTTSPSGDGATAVWQLFQDSNCAAPIVNCSIDFTVDGSCYTFSTCGGAYTGSYNVSLSLPAWAIALLSIASLLALALIIGICICCYRKRAALHLAAAPAPQVVQETAPQALPMPPQAYPQGGYALAGPQAYAQGGAQALPLQGYAQGGAFAPQPYAYAQYPQAQQAYYPQVAPSAAPSYYTPPAVNAGMQYYAGPAAGLGAQPRMQLYEAVASGAPPQKTL